MYRVAVYICKYSLAIIKNHYCWGYLNSYCQIHESWFHRCGRTRRRYRATWRQLQRTRKSKTTALGFVTWATTVEQRRSHRIGRGWSFPWCEWLAVGWAEDRLQARLDADQRDHFQDLFIQNDDQHDRHLPQPILAARGEVAFAKITRVRIPRLQVCS